MRRCAKNSWIGNKIRVLKANAKATYSRQIGQSNKQQNIGDGIKRRKTDVKSGLF